RVPIAVGSIADFTFLTKTKTTVEAVNQAMVDAAKGELKGILETTDKPLVSSDVIGRECSALMDLGLTKVVDGDLVKVFAWYDNEWGFVVRMMELAVHGK
ncbi:MAG TPA: type I glyceraldehyde-3-phosphate dehydrogenase, partial [Patescibacteria group bacterium]|nr:type I glyceraldehyde-3-phosphate dehydrogenase [Patescibacteria group bacterium]